MISIQDNDKSSNVPEKSESTPIIDTFSLNRQNIDSSIEIDKTMLESSSEYKINNDESSTIRKEDETSLQGSDTVTVNQNLVSSGEQTIKSSQIISNENQYSSDI